MNDKKRSIVGCSNQSGKRAIYPIHLTFAGLAASISRNVSQFRSFRAGRASTPRAIYTNAPQIKAVDTIVRTSRGVSKGVSI